MAHEEHTRENGVASLPELPRTRTANTLVGCGLLFAVALLLVVNVYQGVFRPRPVEPPAQGEMRTISTAQGSYQAAGVHMAEGIGQYATLATLANPGNGTAPFIDDVLGSGLKHGYSFVVTVTIGDPPAYTCTATPIGIAGVTSYFVDQTGVIRCSWDGTVATAESDIVQ